MAYGDDEEEEGLLLAALENVENLHFRRHSDNSNGSGDRGVMRLRDQFQEQQLRGTDWRSETRDNTRFGVRDGEQHREQQRILHPRIRTSDLRANELEQSVPAKRRYVGGEQIGNSQQLDGEASREPEGEYMAALRGSNSELWQSKSLGLGRSSTRGRGTPLGFRGGGRAMTDVTTMSGTCYKCGIEGHWAKDCTNGLESNGGLRTTGGSVEQVEPERLCNCGAGVCNILTANTEMNQGRKFYRCPLRKEDGQCGFFEWCDASAKCLGSVTESEQTNVPVLKCKCGGGTCAVLTARTRRNLGRLFYRCPLLQEEGSCGFFQWCDEAGGNSTRAGAFTTNLAGSPGSCFKCGQEGHWSKDCTGSSSFGSPGQHCNFHDRVGQGRISRIGASVHSSTFGPNSDFKVLNQNTTRGNHLSCLPNISRHGGGGNVAMRAQAAQPGSGNCYKCGKPGHWANKCTGS